MVKLKINKIDMSYDKDFSIIIPHRNSLHFLPKLFSSIPKSDKIEIILVDNSIEKISETEIRSIGVSHDFILLYSNPSRGAGGARNIGIENAHGKWLLFLDADDYFADNAFKTFYKYINCDAELIYFGVGSVYEDTGEKANRGENYNYLVKSFISNKIEEIQIRLKYSSPCSKMVSHSLVDRQKIRYDEVLASNDEMFSLLTGYYAKKILADTTKVYIVTVSKGSLTRRKDLAVIQSRYKVGLRYNKFLRNHDLSKYQKSVMVYFYDIRNYGIKNILKFLLLAIKYRQNLLIGLPNWIDSLKRRKTINKNESQYITK